MSILILGMRTCVNYYLGYSRLGGLTIALKTCRPDFLQALFDRSDEPSQDFTKYFVTVSLLNDLHRENVSFVSMFLYMVS